MGLTREERNKLNAAWKEAMLALRSTVEDIQNLNDQFSAGGQCLTDFFKDFRANTTESLIILAKAGWFIDLHSDIGMHLYLAKEISAGRIDYVNKYLSAYYEDAIPYIERRLKGRHPHRKQIFREIFSGYKRGEYILIMPTIYSQVDGICHDAITGSSFFRGRIRKELSNDIVNRSSDLLKIFSKAIQDKLLPVYAGEKQMKKNQFLCTLNRHEVMHGISTNYGNKTNALKSISLLIYMSDILSELDNIPSPKINLAE